MKTTANAQSRTQSTTQDATARNSRIRSTKLAALLDAQDDQFEECVDWVANGAELDERAARIVSAAYTHKILPNYALSNGISKEEISEVLRRASEKAGETRTARSAKVNGQPAASRERGSRSANIFGDDQDSKFGEGHQNRRRMRDFPGNANDIESFDGVRPSRDLDDSHGFLGGDSDGAMPFAAKKKSSPDMDMNAHDDGSSDDADDAEHGSFGDDDEGGEDDEFSFGDDSANGDSDGSAAEDAGDDGFNDESEGGEDDMSGSEPQRNFGGEGSGDAEGADKTMPLTIIVTPEQRARVKQLLMQEFGPDSISEEDPEDSSDPNALEGGDDSDGQGVDADAFDGDEPDGFDSGSNAEGGSNDSEDADADDADESNFGGPELRLKGDDRHFDDDEDDGEGDSFDSDDADGSDGSDDSADSFGQKGGFNPAQKKSSLSQRETAVAGRQAQSRKVTSMKNNTSTSAPRTRTSDAQQRKSERERVLAQVRTAADGTTYAPETVKPKDRNLGKDTTEGTYMGKKSKPFNHDGKAQYKQEDDWQTMRLTDDGGDDLAKDDEGPRNFRKHDIPTLNPADRLGLSGSYNVVTKDGEPDGEIAYKVDYSLLNNVPSNGGKDFEGMNGDFDAQEFDLPTRIKENAKRTRTISPVNMATASKKPICEGCDNPDDFRVDRVSCSDCGHRYASCDQCIAEDYCPFCSDDSRTASNGGADTEITVNAEDEDEDCELVRKNRFPENGDGFKPSKRSSGRNPRGNSGAGARNATASATEAKNMEVYQTRLRTAYAVANEMLRANALNDSKDVERQVQLWMDEGTTVPTMMSTGSLMLNLARANEERVAAAEVEARRDAMRTAGRRSGGSDTGRGVSFNPAFAGGGEGEYRQTSNRQGGQRVASRNYAPDILQENLQSYFMDKFDQFEEEDYEDEYPTRRGRGRRR